MSCLTFEIHARKGGSQGQRVRQRHVSGKHKLQKSFQEEFSGGKLSSEGGMVE